MTAPTRFRLQPDVARCAGGRLLVGGVPPRVLRLSGRGAAALDALVAAGLADGDRAGAALARRLVEADVLRPRPAPRAAAAGEVTVCIPTRDGAARLPALLGRLHGLAVVVVDDGSRDAGAVAAAVAAAGARLVRRARSGGPAAARNAGLRAAGTALVAFLDDDCRPEPGWLEALLAHASSEGVAAVAPRVVGAGGPGVLARYDAAASPLDLGARGGAVGPGRPIPYVPSAALLVRRDAVLAEGGFCEELRYGEDVDLCWRLAARGWTVRYEPAATVVHASRDGARAMARQRFAYGGSAAALSLRHRGAVAPFRARPRAAATAALVLGGRGLVAGLAVVEGARALRAALPDDVPARDAARLARAGNVAVVRQAARAARREWLPFAVAAGVASRRARRGLLVSGAAELAATWLAGPRTVGLPAYAVLRVADDAAYAAGVWAGCVSRRTFAPLRPALGPAPRLPAPAPAAPAAGSVGW